MKFLRNLLFPHYVGLLADIVKLKMVLVRIDRQAMLEAFPDNAEVIEKIAPDDGGTLWRITKTMHGMFQVDRREFSHCSSSQLGCTSTHYVWKPAGSFLTADAARKCVEEMKQIEAVPVEYVR